MAPTLVLPRDRELVSELKDFFAPSGLDITWNLFMSNYWVTDFDGVIAYKKGNVDEIYIVTREEKDLKQVEDFAKNMEDFLRSRNFDCSVKSNAELQNGNYIGLSVVVSFS